jgi:hypothetical protein
MRNYVFGMTLLICSTALAVDITITWDQWPYGVRCIGDYSKWLMSPDAGHVTVPSFNADDTIWDLVDLGGSAVNRNAESDIRPKSEAEGSPPSYCTYAEKQIFNGQRSWGYEHMDTSGSTQDMWLYGFYTGGTQVDYDSPYQRVYEFPMHYADHWQANWTWNYQGMDLVTESRDNYVVAEGWVRVPADSFHYYPCLVIRTYSHTYDELGVLDDTRIIHEWDVPDMGAVGGAVATIQSQRDETNPDFTDAEHVFKMKLFHSIFDNQPPTFAQTTRVPSGYNLGPFFVSSHITDANAVRKDSLYYRIGAGLWQVAGHDSTRNDNYYFHIPLLAGSDTVLYYLAASDTAPARNRGTDPEGAPGGFYQFYARDPADDHYPPVITGTTRWTDTSFTGPFAVTANVVDSCFVDSVLVLYRINAGSEQAVIYDSVQGSNYYLTIPSAGLNSFIRYKIRAVDGSPNHNAALDPGSGYYSFNVVDATGPDFANTTVWPDTGFPGPFPVQSRVTDVSGVLRVQVVFKYGSSVWDSLPSDSTRDSVYHCHLPVATSPMSVRYYLKAADNSQRHNVATDPANAPSECYEFFCDPQGGIADEPIMPAGFAVNLMSINPGVVALDLPGKIGTPPVFAAKTVASLFSASVYDMKGSRVAEIISGSCRPGRLTLAIPTDLPAGSYVLDIVYGGQHYRRGFVIAR